MTGSDKSRKFDYLWIVLFLIIFINGFEAGGYQASLRNIGQNYDLSVTSMGLFAATELFATMLAPLMRHRLYPVHPSGLCLRCNLSLRT